MTTALVPHRNKEQEELFNTMNRSWQGLATKAETIWSEMVGDLIWKNYDLGVIVNAFKGDEKRYGEGAVESLATLLNTTAARLWECARLATCYSKDELKELLAKNLKTGRAIEYGHLRMLASMTQPETVKIRKQLEKAVVTERLTVADLAQRVQKAMGRRSAGSGRTPLPPSSPAAGIGQMIKQAESYTKRFKGWDKVVHTGLQKAGADQLSDKTLEQLREGLQAQLQLKETLEANIDHFEATIERVERVLDQPEAKAEVKAETKASTNGHAKAKAATNGAAPRGAGATPARAAAAARKGQHKARKGLPPTTARRVRRSPAALAH